MRCLAVILALAVPAFAEDATIIDASGKEIVLKKWSFAAGVVKPAWLGKDAPGDGKKHEAAQAVRNLQALYRVEKSEKLMPTIMFKKTYKLDLGQLKKMTVHEQDKSFECEVTLKDGTTESLTLLTSIPLDGKPA